MRHIFRELFLLILASSALAASISGDLYADDIEVGVGMTSATTVKFLSGDVDRRFEGASIRRVKNSNQDLAEVVQSHGSTITLRGKKVGSGELVAYTSKGRKTVHYRVLEPVVALNDICGRTPSYQLTEGALVELSHAAGAVLPFSTELVPYGEVEDESIISDRFPYQVTPTDSIEVLPKNFWPGYPACTSSGIEQCLRIRARPGETIELVPQGIGGPTYRISVTDPAKTPSFQIQIGAVAYRDADTEEVRSLNVGNIRAYQSPGPLVNTRRWFLDDSQCRMGAPAPYRAESQTPEICEVVGAPHEAFECDPAFAECESLDPSVFLIDAFKAGTCTITAIPLLEELPSIEPVSVEVDA